jgi:hypothetical protein
MEYKYSLISGLVRWSGGSTVLGIGMSAEADHPLVLERPDLFGDDAPHAALRTPAAYRAKEEAAPAEAPIERATRAPGEKRVAVKKPTNE